MGALLVARSPDHVDTAFVNAVMGSQHGRVTRVRTERVGTGQLALTLRAHLDWDADDPSRPTSVIVKLVSNAPDGRDRSRRHDSYRREVWFYTRIVPLVSVPVPTCHHAAFDEDDGAFTLVLSDIDGRVGDQVAGCTVAQAEAIVDAAVGLHAPTWDISVPAGELSWLGDESVSRAAAIRRADRYSGLLPGFVERFAGRLNADVMDVARWTARRVLAMHDHQRLPLCVTHNDYRIDNMVFSGTGGSSVSILDWQTVATGRGPADVAYALGAGLLQHDRRANEQLLIDRYADAMEGRGVTCDRADLYNDYVLGSATGLIMAVIASQVVVRTPRGDEMFALMAERHAQQMMDLGIQEILP